MTVKYDLKIFFADDSQVDLEAFIPVFHRLIQTQRLDEVLIDVADYRHVPHGPGVVLIAHDAHYAIDTADGRAGLLYSRRRETHPRRAALSSEVARLHSVLSCTLAACQQLETDTAFQGRLRFRSDELLLRCNDRFLTADSVADYEELYQHVVPCLDVLYPGQHVEVSRLQPRSARLTIAVKSAEVADVSTLLTRLQAAERGREAR